MQKLIAGATLLIAALLGLGLSAQAADLYHRKSMSDEALEVLQRNIVKLMDAGEFGSPERTVHSVDMVEILSQGRRDTLRRIVWQILHETAPTPQSRPEHLTLRRVDNVPEARPALADAIVGLRYDSLARTKPSYARVKELLTITLQRRDRFHLYVGSHGNSFGSMDFALVHDTRNQQILILGTGLGE